MPSETTYDTKKIIVFGIILLAIVAVIGFLVFRKMNPAVNTPDQKNLFPYDGSISAGTTGSGTGAVPIENPVRETQLSSATSDRLRIIANYPVTSMYAYLQNKLLSEPKYDEKSGQTVIVSRSVPTNHVRFNAKQNGFLVEAEVEKNLISITQKTDTPVPNSEEVWFGNQGNAITYRSWDMGRKTITTFSGTIPSPASINYCQKPLKTILGTGSKGDEVRELQKYLNAKISAGLTVDGAYGKKITTTIPAIRKMLVLDPTGKYDQGLIDAINTDCANTMAALEQKSQGIQKISGEFIDTGILRGDMSPDGTKMFFLKPTSTGVSGIVADSNGKNQRQVFTSPITEWKPQWVNPTTIAMTTLASSESDGYAYFLNPVTGSFQKVMGPVRGLTTLVNPSGTMLLFSRSEKRRLVMGTYAIATGATVMRDLTTIPEKCTWQTDTVAVCAIPQGISSGQYPDDWYQGNAIFNDSFWSLDTAQGSTATIVSPSQKFDAYKLTLSPDSNYLYFINKIDGALWSYRLGDE